MLQQTQVGTVVGYYSRFVERLPDVHALAAASSDEVMGLWSGLGYYSRARNLHRCAIQVVGQWNGEFPRSAQALAGLPGIGRSTAAAIASLCFGERVAILDANVRRVLTRVLAFEDDLALQASQRTLWDAATRLLPDSKLPVEMPHYTQGMMDLGATVCLPREPLCASCPVQSLCAAHRQGAAHNYPVRGRKLKRTADSIWLLWARTHDDAIWLRKRPAPGIWAGLHCPPWFASREALVEQVPTNYRAALQDQEPFRHVLTHKDLYLHPVRLVLPGAALVQEHGQWFDAGQWPRLGLPAPVRRLLLQA